MGHITHMGIREKVVKSICYSQKISINKKQNRDTHNPLPAFSHHLTSYKEIEEIDGKNVLTTTEPKLSFLISVGCLYFLYIGSYF